MKKVVLILMCVLGAGISNAALTGSITDFEAPIYAIGAIDGQDGWTTSVAGFASHAVADDGTGNQVLSYAANTGTLTTSNRALGTAIADGTQQAVSLRMMATNDAGMDHWFGLTDTTTSTWSNFEVQIGIKTVSGELVFQARNAGSSTTVQTGLSANTWYHIWVDVDNAADTYDVFLGTSSDPFAASLVADDFSFRNGVAANDLDGLQVMSSKWKANALYIDDIAYTDVVPEPATLALLGLGSLVLLRKKK